MKRVITASLGGNPYPLDEDAHARLARYLEDAARTLAANPDREEILGDLERGIASQCQRRLAPGTTVIDLQTLDAALAEIGPVRSEPGGESAAIASPPARIEQISEGAWISGVCNGLAQGMNADVSLVRLVAVILGVFSGGAMIAVYLALMLVMPYAPLSAPAASVAWLPSRCRNVVERLRASVIAAFR